MAMHNITVVMAVYNGEKYIEEQLNSILKQSRQPDELIILDDCSTDNSVKITEQITKPYRNIDIKIIINSENLGWKANFMKGFHLASGDIIFCADQDDIWDTRKIEVMTNIMSDNEQINALCCNLQPLYHDGSKKLAKFAVEKYGNQLLEKISIYKSGFTVLRPGCTMCFRKTMLNSIDAVWTPQLAHDEVIWAIALVTDSLYIFNEGFIQFRRHGNNNSPSNERKVSARLDRAICTKIKMQNLLDEIQMSQDAKDYCKKSLNKANKRVKALENKSIIDALLILPSIRSKKGFKSWIADIYTIVKSKQSKSH